MDKKLTAKQKLFVDEYCNNGLNASKAYKTAYPNCKSGWNVHGCRNIAKDNIKKAIAEKQAQAKEKALSTRQRRQRFWQAVMDGEIARDGSTIVNMSDRLRASELWGKSEMDFIDVHKDLTEKQKELTEAEKAEAKRLANIRLRKDTG